MPIRKRRDRRKQAAGTLDDWEWSFDMGWPCTGDLHGIVELDENGQLPREAAEAAWHRLGREHMANWHAEHPNGPGRYGPPWALSEFGDP